MLVAVVAERTPLGVLEVLRHLATAHSQGTVMAEVRLDALDKPEVDVLLGSPLPVIATCRRETDGGWWHGPEHARMNLLEKALKCGAAMVDVELDAITHWTGPLGRQLVVSHHDPTGTPRDLDRIVEKALAVEAGFIKIATRANTTADVLTLARICERAPGRVVAFGLGADALGTRILFRRMGSAWIYARARGPTARERLEAPGLPDIADVVGLYGADSRLSNPVAAFALFSEHPSASIGPMVFNRVFRQLQLSATYAALPAQGIHGVRELMKRLELRGASLTTPLKEVALQAADTVHPLARAIGAANTYVHQEGRITAYNTDYHGVREVVQQALGSEVASGRALVVGAGGAARAAVLALLQMGFHVEITARTMARAERVASELGVAAIADPKERPRLIVNATPAGGARAAGLMPVSADLLGKDQILFDMNYRPRETALLRAGRPHGAILLGGERMFAVQAAHQLNLWWGGLPDVAHRIKEAVQWTLRERPLS